ncbi:MAG TPA: DsbA family protein [Marmoricola sp.]|nr:DsbA family protein [Marmoricola sp.]
MSAALLDRPAPTGPAPRAEVRSLRAVEPEEPIVVYGDFNCPWSYLAFRRAAVLSAAGMAVDWRAVEHAPRRVRPAADRVREFESLPAEMDRVVAMLLPGELLPYDLSGFVPETRASVAAYAEGYAAHVAGPVRKVLFEAFWMHGIDIGDAKVLRTLLVDELRGGSSPSDTVREWGYPVDVTGGPISTSAWRLASRWSAEWQGRGRRVVPLLVAPGVGLQLGVDAVRWLGEQIVAHDLDLEPPATDAPQPPDCRELPSIAWVTTNGGQWLSRCTEHEQHRARRDR